MYNTAKVEKGNTVAVFGLGAVGLAVIEASREVGASRILAIDTNPEKFEVAKSCCATGGVNPKEFAKREDSRRDCENDRQWRRFLVRMHRERGRDASSLGVRAQRMGRIRHHRRRRRREGNVATRPFQLVTRRVWRDLMRR